MDNSPSAGDAARVSKALLPTDQTLAPAGRTTTFAARPLDLALSGNELAVKTSHGLLFVDVRTGKIDQTLALPNDLVDYPKNLGGNGLIGVVWSGDGKRVWSADGFGVLRSAVVGPAGRSAWEAPIKLAGPSGNFTDPKSKQQDPSVPTGIALSSDERYVFVACSRNDSVAIVDVRRRVVVASVRVGVSPFALLRRGELLYVSNLGGDHAKSGEASADSGGARVRVDARGIARPGSISVIDLQTRSVVATIPTGRHPEAMATSAAGDLLYVLNANDDSITIIDRARAGVVKTVALPLQNGPGANPNALAVRPSDGRLFVAEGGDNRVVVLDPASFEPVGEIATGWYPDAVALGSEGTVYITSLKGWGGRGNDFGFSRRKLGFRLDVPLGREAFNVYDYAGTLQILSQASLKPAEPSGAAFATSGGTTESHLPPFKHVVFIIKENHTYDDYFGDVKRGDGDPRYCAFPQHVSPNHHALAQRFGFFDNFYVNGTMSGDGHQWTNEAGTTDYVERNTASWAKTYPSDGTDPLAYTASGFIWQRVLDSGRTFRDYGEFVVSEPATTPENANWLQFYNDRRHGTHIASFKNALSLKSLRPYVDMAYPAFTLRISDQARADEFIRELRGFERSGRLPSFVLMQLGNDHTAGSFPGYPVPTSAVADNDLALGRIVDAISHSSYWKNTVVFVVEDDAQNGVDHVDGHRTMALVISAYNKKHAVDSSFYNQTSILRTIEAIFGLQPLTQFDAASPPIADIFALHASQPPYNAVPNSVPLDVINPKRASFYPANASASLEASDFDRPDAVDPSFFTPVLSARRQ
jgi:YVTN family beta-propeller protein